MTRIVIFVAILEFAALAESLRTILLVADTHVMIDSSKLPHPLNGSRNTSDSRTIVFQRNRNENRMRIAFVVACCGCASWKSARRSRIARYLSASYSRSSQVCVSCRSRLSALRSPLSMLHYVTEGRARDPALARTKKVHNKSSDEAAARPSTSRACRSAENEISLRRGARFQNSKGSRSRDAFRFTRENVA